jgi:uncharacterized protein
MTQTMRNPPATFHVMAKPTGSRCNLAGSYFIFLKKERHCPGSEFRMAGEIMEIYIRQTIAANRVRQVTIAWQGGEPTLMSLDFFRRSIEIEKSPRNPGWTLGLTGVFAARTEKAQQ